MKEESEIKAIGLTIKNVIKNNNDLCMYCEYNDPLTRKSYWVKASRGFGWEHVSVDGRSKCPTWELMCKIKDMFFKDDEVCMQLHPAKENCINNAEHMLHIWHPLESNIPLPPEIMVGIKGISEAECKAACSIAVSNMTDEEKLLLSKKYGFKMNRQMKRVLK